MLLIAPGYPDIQNEARQAVFLKRFPRVSESQAAWFSGLCLAEHDDLSPNHVSKPGITVWFSRVICREPGDLQIIAMTCNHLTVSPPLCSDSSMKTNGSDSAPDGGCCCWVVSKHCWGLRWLGSPNTPPLVIWRISFWACRLGYLTGEGSYSRHAQRP